MYPSDALIAYFVETGRYHVIMFRDFPMPGGPRSDFRRLKSAGHHTQGVETFEQAQAELDRLVENPQFVLPKLVIRDKLLILGGADNAVMTLVTPLDALEVGGMIEPDKLQDELKNFRQPV